MEQEIHGEKFHTWLKRQIDSQSYLGLEYIDINKTFRIPWNPKNSLEEDEIKLYMAYSEYKGKNELLQAAKTKFRNTLTKSLYFRMVFENTKDQMKNYKVFEFLSQEKVAQKRKKSKKRKSSVETMTLSPCSPSQSPLQDQQPQSSFEEAAPLPELEVTNEDFDDSFDLELLNEENLPYEYSYTNHVFTPTTALQQELHQSGIQLKDTGKFVMSLIYDGVVVGVQLIDFMQQQYHWILHGACIQSYKGLLEERKGFRMENACTLQLPESNIPDVKEILEKLTFGVIIGFDFQTLGLCITRLSKLRIFSSRCKNESKLERFVPEYQPLFPVQQDSISDSLTYELNFGRRRDEAVSGVTIRLQSAIANKIEKYSRGNTNQESLCLSSDKSIDDQFARMNLNNN